ncbi:uncharacterized protein [Haliotis asinina]|uniref:uncharacterized protein n=1 Tax=Haliotis asinina TaxID=109174 RepID=UPI003531AD6B
MHERLSMNRNLFLWLLCVTAAICRGKQVSTFAEVPDAAGRQKDYNGYKIVANPYNCKEYCQTYAWCFAAEFDFNTHDCFLYKGDTQLSYKKGRVFMKRRYTKVKTSQPTTTTKTTTATSTSTTAAATSSFYTILKTVGPSTTTTTTRGPSRTDERHTARLSSPKSTFTEDTSVSTSAETTTTTPSSSIDFTTPQTTSGLGLLPDTPEAVNFYTGQSLSLQLSLVDSNIVHSDVDQFVRNEAPLRQKAGNPHLCFNIDKFKHVTLPGKTFLVLSCDKGKGLFLSILQTTRVVCFHVSYRGNYSNDPVLRVGEHHCKIPETNYDQ